MARPVLLVFVKAPTPGRAKTRCVPFLTPDQATQLYGALVRDTLRVISELRQMQPIITYAADERFPDLRWLDTELPMMAQRGATLGDRLIRAFDEAFSHGAPSVLALGSDAPELSSGWLGQALEALRRHDLVVGPTRDGGYHLIGLTRPQPTLFRDMPWSQPQLLTATLAEAARLGLSVQRLAPIEDLDTPEDLKRYLASAGRTSMSAAAQCLRALRLGRSAATRASAIAS